MAGLTSQTNKIVNARILSEMAVQFNIGADILAKGNRHIESKLGAENMSGDTVMVPIVDGGSVFHHLDLSSDDLSVQRDAVPVTVGPLSTAAALSQEELTLMMKQPEVMGKRVANMALEASNMAVQCLESNSLNATVISSSDITNNAGFAGRNKLYDLFALCEASKLAGETFGVVHPMVWSKLVAMFQGNYAPADKVGGDLYKNELGELAGIKWSKTNMLKTITGATITTTSNGNRIVFDFQAAFTVGKFPADAPNAVPSYSAGAFATITAPGNFFPATGNKVGDMSQPFTLSTSADGTGNQVYSTDIFGNSTGHKAVFHLIADTVDGSGAVTAAHLSAPVFFEGPRQNVYCASYTKYNNNDAAPSTSAQLTLYATALLSNGTSYLQPALVWKRDDFLVAVKGLEQFFGCDSMTIPTVYKDKNILPLRGWAWTNPEKAKTLFRVDVLLGMAAYTRTSMNALYIQA